jgi:hypothetical protein
MNEQEGVIKYHLDHHSAFLDDSLSIVELTAWRSLLYKLKLIGQSDERYDGYGFGNISQRIKQANSDNIQFIISGTQTGHIESLSRQHVCHVLEANPDKNSVKSTGKVEPSSEALTHASIYQQHESIQSVIHVHSPNIWNHTHALNIPFTAASIPYGTPEMAEAITQLFQSPDVHSSSIISMLGHTDGIIAFSSSPEIAFNYLTKALFNATVLEQSKEQG